MLLIERRKRCGKVKMVGELLKDSHDGVWRIIERNNPYICV